MATIHFRETTTSTPEQFIAALTDFGRGRSQVFNKSADDYLKVYSRGATDADVTEGSGGVWERLHYDWSDPNRVIIRTTDSNVWSGHSGHTYTFTRNPDGTTNLDVVIVREARTSRARRYNDPIRMGDGSFIVDSSGAETASRPGIRYGGSDARRSRASTL